MKAGRDKINKLITMKILKTVYKLIAFSFVLVLFSCTKEEEPIKLAEVNVVDFDAGHLIITLYDDPVYLDSIYYINNTKGTSFKIEKTAFSGYDDPLNTVTQISRNLLSGNSGDIVQCCFYVNTPIVVKASFDLANSNTSGSTGGNPFFCITGTY